MYGCGKHYSIAIKYAKDSSLYVFSFLIFKFMWKVGEWMMMMMSGGFGEFIRDYSTTINHQLNIQKVSY